MSDRVVYLWDREDGSRIKAVPEDREVPHGVVYAVKIKPGSGKAADRARQLLAKSRVDPEGMDPEEAGPFLAAKLRVRRRDLANADTPLTGVRFVDELGGGE